MEARVAEANRRGEHLLAIAMAQSALEKGGAAAGLKRQFALALARSGSPREAMGVLEELREGFPPDAETLGMLGRVHKDLAAAASGAEAAALLRKARDFYGEGFAVGGDAYCGINAAALSAVLGERGAAAELARAVLAGPGQGDAFWDCATEAEARLILDGADAAREIYARAAELGAGRAARRCWTPVSAAARWWFARDTVWMWRVRRGGSPPMRCRLCERGSRSGFRTMGFGLCFVRRRRARICFFSNARRLRESRRTSCCLSRARIF
jgi:hypothetical protein